MAKATYDATTFEVLEKLEMVKRHVGMYTDAKSSLHIIMEIVDNALDETVKMERLRIRVSFINNEISVRDFGRGIPFDIHQQTGIPVIRLTFERLHAGAKMSQSAAYTVSAGVHGVGSAVTNALSTYLKAYSYRDGTVCEVEYKDSEYVSLQEKKASEPNGTLVTFSPNSSYFENACSEEMLREMLIVKAAVTGIAFEYVTSTGTELIKVDLLQFFKERNPSKYISTISFVGTGGKESNPIRFEGFILVYSSDADVNDASFYNNIRTRHGGTHEDAAREGVLEAINAELSQDIRLDKMRRDDLCYAICISVHIPSDYHPRLDSQQKTRLYCAEIQHPISLTVQHSFVTELQNNNSFRNKVVEAISSKISKRERKKSEEAAKQSTVVKVTKPLAMISPRKWDGNTTEIFLTEGESATPAEAFDRTFQGAILLRGKVKNPLIGKKTSNDALDFLIQETRIGRVNKIIILTDADPPGDGIAASILLYFIIKAPDLVAQGYIYRVQPPLFKFITKDEEVFFSSNPSAYEYEERNRLKGLGGMGKQDIVLCTKPNTRQLERYVLGEATIDEVISQAQRLMGSDNSYRKELFGIDVDVAAEEE